MLLLEKIIENLNSGMIFVAVFLVSVIISKLYECKIKKYTNDGDVIIRKVSRPFQFLAITAIIIGPVLLIGLRNQYVGADTYNNCMSYLNVGNINFTSGLLSLNDSRVLYYLLQEIIYLLFRDNYTIFLIIIAFLTLYIFVLTITKWIDKISLPLSLFLYYMFFGGILLDQSRQMLAVSIVLYAYYIFEKGSRKKYLFIICIAALIHFTALVGILFYFIDFKKNRLINIKEYIFYFICLISPIIAKPILTLIANLLPSKYAWYLTNLSFEGGYGWIINIIPILIPIIILNKYYNNNYYNTFKRIIFLSFVFRIIGYYSFFLMRLYYYCAILAVYMIPYGLNSIKSNSKKRIIKKGIILLYLSYFIINFLGFDAGQIFPYRTIFYMNVF